TAQPRSRSAPPNTWRASVSFRVVHYERRGDRRSYQLLKLSTLLRPERPLLRLLHIVDSLLDQSCNLSLLTKQLALAFVQRAAPDIPYERDPIPDIEPLFASLRSRLRPRHLSLGGFARPRRALGERFQANCSKPDESKAVCRKGRDNTSRLVKDQSQ